MGGGEERGGEEREGVIWSVGVAVECGTKGVERVRSEGAQRLQGQWSLSHLLPSIACSFTYAFDNPLQQACSVICAFHCLRSSIFKVTAGASSVLPCAQSYLPQRLQPTNTTHVDFITRHAGSVPSDVYLTCFHRLSSHSSWLRRPHCEDRHSSWLPHELIYGVSSRSCWGCIREPWSFLRPSYAHTTLTPFVFIYASRRSTVPCRILTSVRRLFFTIQPFSDSWYPPSLQQASPRQQRLRLTFPLRF